MRIAVIGAGLLGVTTAYFLSKSGHEIIVVDRNDGPGMETSFANGGMLTPSQAGPWNLPGITLKLLGWLARNDTPIIIQPSALLSYLQWGILFLKNSAKKTFTENLYKNAVLARYSLEILTQIREHEAIEFDYSPSGTLKIYRKKKDFYSACNMLNTYNSDLINYEIADRDRVVSIEPSLSTVKENISGGIYYPDDESGDAYKFCRELADIAIKDGVKFLYRTSVDGFKCSGDRIQSITTTNGPVQADEYVLAAGSYSPILANQLGISLPIKPVKGYSLTINNTGNKAAPVVPIIDETCHIAITPLANKIRISGTAELSGYNTSIHPKRTNKMIKFIQELYPDLVNTLDQSAIEEWAGLRPYCCDGVPILGKSARKNLYLNTGHGHLGWTLAAGSAKLVADLISSGKTELKINSYGVERFYK